MTHRFKVAKFTAVGALIVSASLFSAPSASADDGNIYVSQRDPQGNTRAIASFRSYGDELQACDVRADGYGAWAGLYKNVYNGSGVFIKSVSAGGNGNCRTNTQNVTEGTVVWIKICLRQNGINFACKWSHSGYA